ncbi:MAG TPA: farnesyl diphosphate synthase [Vicinamibacterales bacterium]|nr:farnesyl diphosphate synthase [Vicinamibacterales bacterium]
MSAPSHDAANPAGDLRGWLEARRNDVDAALERFLPSAPACPARVGEAMRYSLFAGGKRLRPILALAAAEAAGRAHGLHADEARALSLPAACALELIHTYSLVHDDLPAMDDDTLRRGRPTNHVVFGEGQAILAGDGLLTEAFALMAREPAEPALAARKLHAIRVVADAAGPCGMVGGQAIDLEAAGSGSSFDAEGLRAMHARKTGALIRASAAAGAIMAGATAAQVQAIERYASELGLAFQIVDDILDVEGASQALGKTAGKDAAAGKPTYPALYGLDPSRRMAADCVERAIAALDARRDAADFRDSYLPAIARWVISRTN